MTDIQYLTIIGMIYLSHETNSAVRFILGMTAIIFASLKGLGIL